MTVFAAKLSQTHRQAGWEPRNQPRGVRPSVREAHSRLSACDSERSGFAAARECLRRVIQPLIDTRSVASGICRQGRAVSLWFGGMPGFRHGNRSRVNPGRHHDDTFGGPRNHSVGGRERLGRGDFGVHQGSDDQSGRLSRPLQNTGQLIQAGHAVGIDRPAQLGFIYDATGCQRVNPGQCLNGRACPHLADT